VTTKQTLGQRLAQLRREKAARERRDIQQLDMARAAGVSKTAVSRYERDIDVPREATLEKLAAIRLDVAHVAFVTTGTALLAWRLTRDALWPLWIFASPSFLFAALLGQWSPWLTIGALVPSAGFLLAAKPTLGLACWLYRPTRRHVWTGLALVALSLAVVPTWPMRWLDNLGEVIQHPAPITYQWGPLLALALLRWRTREAWFLLAMACVPQLLFFADQLPLFLVCRTRREALAFVGWGMAVLIVFLTPAFVGYAAPWALAACYLPALAIVLRRPNTA
jgi:transcriptional regulator with XRE-family HTH domain